MVAESVLALAFLAGLISFLSPCIVPMIMVYFGLITGLTTEELMNEHDLRRVRKNTIINTILFIIGFSIIFTLAGSAAGFAGSLITGYAEVMTRVGGVLLILLGVHVTGIARLHFIERLIIYRDPSSISSVGYLGSFLVGVFFAIFCSHCIAPTLYSMLIFAGGTGSVQSGALIMAFFSMGLAIPYIITAFGINSSLERIRDMKKHIKLFSIINGIILIILGILMLSGNFYHLVELSANLIPFELPVGMGV